MKFLLGSLADTQRFAEIVASHVRPRDMIVLAGEMGAGKTTFTQFFGRALGVTDLITSPTFNLLHNYGSGRMALHHADLYRLERTGELEDLGLDELQDSGGVIAVEWGDIVVTSWVMHWCCGLNTLIKRVVKQLARQTRRKCGK